MTWLPAPGGVLAFDRGTGVRCVCNLSSAPIDLPEHAALLLASGPLAHGKLPPDTTVWLRPAGAA
jgi:alpha-glucosidase